METSDVAASPIRVVVAGPHGRMGRVLMDGLAQQDGLTVTAGVARGDDTAKVLVRELMDDQPPTVDLAPFSPNRFSFRCRASTVATVPAAS